MTIKELKELLNQYPEDTEIRTSEFEQVDDGEGYNDEMEVDVIITGVNMVGGIVYIAGIKVGEVGD
jgi:hypothetical protein